MDPISFSQMLLRRWWLVLILSLAGIVVAYYLETTTPARYQSTVSLQLNPAANSSFLPYSADSGVSQSNQVLGQAASYQEVLRVAHLGRSSSSSSDSVSRLKPSAMPSRRSWCQTPIFCT